MGPSIRPQPLYGLLLLTLACHGSGPTAPGRRTEAFPRCADFDPLRRPFFGDLHVHTTLSLDANLQGTRLTPADAYRFAQGEEVGIQPYDAAGNALRTLRIDRPLDFMMDSDHAEFLGTVALCSTPGSRDYDDAACQQFRNNPDGAFLTINALTAADPDQAHYPDLCGTDGADCKTAGMDVWRQIQQAAEAAYDRTDACTFTSFVGYEWSGGPRTYNIHRNVVFRNEHVPDLPYSYFDEPEVTGLWARLQAECLDKPPCDVLTIPHNSNLSNGLMFETYDEASTGGAADADAAKLRAKWEPLVEIFQHKGSSECQPGAAGSDEQCGFEAVPYHSLSGVKLDAQGEGKPQDFLRTVLGEGLRFEQATGANPYAFGFVASTDTHIGTGGAVSEDSYPGHGGAGRGNRDTPPVGLPDNVQLNPGGLAVLWAEENTREALFRAMRRREAYGTSGPRIVLRVFGGRGYDPNLCDASDFAQQGYANGVPMGGDLPASSDPPTFAISALADPGTAEHSGAPLQRIQVVKGSLDGDQVKVEVFDVAGDANDGSTVDTATCALDSHGFDHLCTVWTDPGFDASVPAFYYVRVLQDPSCRWQSWQCSAAGITCPTDLSAWAGCCDDSVPKTVQERAWSSPIWYTP